jgi:hypothetical protein
MHIYLDGPASSFAEVSYLGLVVILLEEKGHMVTTRHELMADQILEENDDVIPTLISAVCRRAVEECDCCIAVLDGVQVDPIVAWETAYAEAHGKPVLGIRMDARPCGDTPFCMVPCIIHQSLVDLATNPDELLRMLKKIENKNKNRNKSGKRGKPAAFRLKLHGKNPE